MWRHQSIRIGVSAVAAYCTNAIVHCDGSDSHEKEIVGLYLSDKSKAMLAKYLPTRLGIHDYKGEVVVIQRDASESERAVYEPLFGERAAFRLKSYVKTDNGSIAGMGRMSSMSGVISENGEVSLAFIPANKGLDNSSIDLPKRLSNAKVINGKSHWKGNLVGSTVLGAHYSTERASYFEIPFDNQLVIDGVLCSSKFIDQDGKCNFFSSSCPMCKFMESGPCKDQFKAFDKCLTAHKEEERVDKCFDVTAAMYGCMRNHEYYDIMTANFDTSLSSEQLASIANPPGEKGDSDSNTSSNSIDSHNATASTEAKAESIEIGHSAEDHK